MNSTSNVSASRLDQAFGAMRRALASGHRDDWIAASRIWRRDLEDAEVAQLTLAGLLALDDEMGSIALSNAFEEPYMPLAPLRSAMDEASAWADRADYPSVKACTLAGFKRMNSKDQTAFLDFVSPEVAS